MRVLSGSLLLAAIVMLCSCASVPTDLTGANANAFRTHVGHTVTLRGTLEFGKEGLVVYKLVGAAPNDVDLSIVPEMWIYLKTHPGTDDLMIGVPAPWSRLLGRRVVVTKTEEREEPPSHCDYDSAPERGSARLVFQGDGTHNSAG
jgi:hypothetical protein